MSILKVFSWFAFLLLMLSTTGCNSGTKLVPAQGTVYKPDGTPLTRSGVYFWPTFDSPIFGHDDPIYPYSIVKPDGRFELIMDGGKKGVPPGKYKVTLGILDMEIKAIIPIRYTKIDDSPWEVTVPPSGDTQIILRMEN